MCFKHVKSLPVAYNASKKARMIGALFTERQQTLTEGGRNVHDRNSVIRGLTISLVIKVIVV